MLHNALSPDDFYADARPARWSAPNSAPKPTRPSSARSPTFAEKRASRAVRRDARRPARIAEDPVLDRRRRQALGTSCRQSARATGVLHNVRFLGFRRDVADLDARDRRDGLALAPRAVRPGVRRSRAVAQAESSRCRAGGAPESIADGETGLLVPVRDSAAIAECAAHAAHQSRSRGRMGQRRLRSCRRHFWLGTIHPHARAVYERVLDERSSPPVRSMTFRCLAPDHTIHDIHRNSSEPQQLARRRFSATRSGVFAHCRRPAHGDTAASHSPLATTPRRAARRFTRSRPRGWPEPKRFWLRLLRRAAPEQFVNHCVTSRSRANNELLAANMPFDRLGIGGKANLLAVPRLRRRRPPLPGRRAALASLDRELVVRLARTTRRPAFHRPRPRLHLRPLAPPSKPPHRLLGRREARPDRQRHRGRSDHRAALSGRSRRHAADALAGRRPPRARRRRPIRPSSARSPTSRPKKGYRELIQAAALVLNVHAERPVLVLRRRPAASRAGTNGPRPRHRRPLQAFRLPPRRGRSRCARST